MVRSRLHPLKASLSTGVAVVLIGLLGLAAGGTAGAAGATRGPTSTGGPPTPTTVPPGTRAAHCAGVDRALSAMRHRQAELSARVARLEAASAAAAKAGKPRRAATYHRYLLLWQRIEAHKIGPRFLRREAELAARAGAGCAVSVPAAPPSTRPATPS